MGLLYLRGRTIQKVSGEMMMGSSIYGVAVIDGSLYSRVYGIEMIERMEGHGACKHYNPPMGKGWGQYARINNGTVCEVFFLLARK